MRWAWLVPAVPVAMHVAILLGYGHAAALSLAVVLIIGMLAIRPLARIRVLFAGFLALSLPLLWWFDAGLWVLFSIPILMHGALLLVFVDSLRVGSDPIATRFSRLLRGEPLPPAVLSYTRNVTRLWAGYFALMLLLSVGLPLWAPLGIWSWFANMVSYLMTASLFVVEFLFRRWWLRHLSHPPVFGYFRKLVQCDWRLVMRR